MNKKKRAKRARRVIKLLNFNLARDVLFTSSNDYNGQQTIKMINRHTDGPLLLSFTRGGWLSKQYGVAVTTYGKINVTFEVVDKEEVRALQKLHQDIIDVAFEHAAHWFGSPMTREEVGAAVYNTFTPPKQKKNSDGFWNATFRCPVAKKEDLTPNRAGQRIVNVVCEQKNIDDICDIRGSQYDKTIVELKNVFFTSEDGQCRFGINKELRAMRILPHVTRNQVGVDDDEEDEVVAA